MKRLIVLLPAAIVIILLVVYLNNQTAVDQAKDTPEEVLNNVWNAYDENEQFSVYGGDSEHMVDGKAATFDISNADTLDSVLGYPSHSVAMLESAASLTHGMLPNLFTASAYRLGDVEDVEMLISDMQENVQNRQWLDGFPDKLLIAKVNDNTLVMAFGETKNIETFEEKLMEVYKDTDIVLDEKISE